MNGRNNKFNSTVFKTRPGDNPSRFSVLNATAATIFGGSNSTMSKSLNRTAVSNLSKDIIINFDVTG